MTVNFRDLFPSIQPVLEEIAHIPLIEHVNATLWIFALVEIGHLLFLATLGGAVLLLNLRVLGLILRSIPLQDVEQALRRWYQAGAAGTIVTGLAMGITTARTLLPSGAFFIKMVALLAAIILSGVVARQVRSGRAAPTAGNIAAIALGFAIWFFALFLFATTGSVNSGSMLIALVGAALLVAITQRRFRPAAAVLATLALGGWYLSLDSLAGYHAGGGIAWIGHGVLAATALPLVGLGAREIRAGNGTKYAVLKLTAFAATLAWITVTAAGRWIGFS